MKVLILANGELYKPDILARRLHDETFNLIIGADAGARHARTLGVEVDVIIGDLDSLPEADRAEFGSADIVPYPEEKDETDLELALRWAVVKGADYILLVCIMGGRLDMAVANVQLLTHPVLAGCRAEIWHGGQTARVVRPPGDEIQGRPGDTVSLIPLYGDVRGITTRGLKYRLHQTRLASGPGRGLSNLMEESTASLELEEGLLLMVHTPGEI